MSEQQPVTGPIPIYVKATPSGAELDMAALTAHVVSDVIDALLDPADTGLWDLLHEVANPPGPAPEGTERLDREQLEHDLADRASSRIPVYGPQVKRLAASLLKAAGQYVPSQREERAA